jgi:hypothetical protein
MEVAERNDVDDESEYDSEDDDREMDKRQDEVQRTLTMGSSTQVPCRTVTTALALNANTSVSTVTNASSSLLSHPLSARSGVVDVRKTLVDMIVNVVNEKVYPYMKFITSDLEMEHDFASFGGKIMKEMKIDESSKREWWNAYKKVAKVALSQKRSSVGAAVKKSLTGT